MIYNYKVNLEACNFGLLSFVGVLVDKTKNIAMAHDDVLVAKIFDKKECEVLKMGAYIPLNGSYTF
jgi:hypothetical protein